MRNVLITGASRGLGLEFVRQYGADGWSVIACCRQPKSARALAGSGADVVKLDVTDSRDVTAIVEAAGGDTIDVFICNAGITGARNPVLVGTTQADFDAVMHTNVLGPMWLSAALADRVAAGSAGAAARSPICRAAWEASAPWPMPAAPFIAPARQPLNAVAKAVALELAPRGVVASHCTRAGFAPTWAARAPISSPRRALPACGPSSNARVARQRALFRLHGQRGAVVRAPRCC